MDPPGSPEREGAEELERLRRRAYGPGADIAGDLWAQARLAELEASRRAREDTADDATRAQHPEPAQEPDGGAAGAVDESASPSAALPAPAHQRGPERASDGASTGEQIFIERPVGARDSVDAAPRDRWHPPRRWWTLAGATGAAALLAAYIVSVSLPIDQEAETTPVGTSTTDAPRLPTGHGRASYPPAPDEVLAMQSVGADAAWPEERQVLLDAFGINADDVRRYEDFQGSLNVWSGESRYGMTCLLVAVPGPRTELSTEGCSLDGLDTIADLQGPSGRIIRFVLRGDDVNVYVYDRAADPNASSD